MLPLNDWGMLEPADTPYPATLEEVRTTFVEGAPFEKRRRLIFRALHLYSDLVWDEFPAARLWINGGFTTHKQWGAPEDADVATIVPIEDYSRAYMDKLLPLSSLQKVSMEQPASRTEKLHPFGGLLDTFFIPDHPAQLAVWHDNWSSVRGPDRKIIEGKFKGFVEVKRT